MTIISSNSSVQTQYTSSTAYNNTPIVNAKYLDLLVYRVITPKINDVYYTIPSVFQYRPDLLAYDLYGDSRLWWVFAARNPNQLGPDPYFNFTAGVSIYVPNAATLKQDLGI